MIVIMEHHQHPQHSTFISGGRANTKLPSHLPPPSSSSSTSNSPTPGANKFTTIERKSIVRVSYCVFTSFWSAFKLTFQLRNFISASGAWNSVFCLNYPKNFCVFSRLPSRWLLTVPLMTQQAKTLLCGVRRRICVEIISSQATIHIEKICNF